MAMETASIDRPPNNLNHRVPGLIITTFTAYSIFLKFSKVWERNNTNRKIRYEPIP
jgi:hypothetical protein